MPLNRSGRAYTRLAPMLLVAALSCDTATLPTGATLIVSFEASILHPAAVPDTPPADEQACVDAGGALVDLRAWTSDGKPADAAQVTLWLDPALGARLSALSRNCAESSRDVCVALDESGEGRACLLPGEHYGTVTVFAHSGAIQQSKSIDVVARVLPAGSLLAVGVSPVDLSSVIPRQPSTCGSPAPVDCTASRARHALVTLVGAAADGAPPPRDGTVVSLAVTAGWISTEGSCVDAMARFPIATTTLLDGTADATWCFGDTAATGTLSARSGNIDGTATAAVAAIPAGLTLTTSGPSVPRGGTATLTAVVTGCDGRGLGSVPVLFRTTAGAAAITPSTPVLSDDQGVATVTVTATTSATISAAVAQAQSVLCDVDVEVTP